MSSFSHVRFLLDMADAMDAAHEVAAAAEPQHDVGGVSDPDAVGDNINDPDVVGDVSDPNAVGDDTCDPDAVGGDISDPDAVGDINDPDAVGDSLYDPDVVDDQTGPVVDNVNTTQCIAGIIVVTLDRSVTEEEVREALISRVRDRGSIRSLHESDDELYFRMATPAQANRVINKMDGITMNTIGVMIRLHQKNTHPSQIIKNVCVVGFWHVFGSLVE